ncbi:hypothetical protein KM043_012005 [Ampulex compressa]|nr:hypothetical protein KM043_012005 [Ampulex compressa]
MHDPSRLKNAARPSARTSRTRRFYSRRTENPKCSLNFVGTMRRGVKGTGDKRRIGLSSRNQRRGVACPPLMLRLKFAEPSDDLEGPPSIGAHSRCWTTYIRAARPGEGKAGACKTAVDITSVPTAGQETPVAREKLCQEEPGSPLRAGFDGDETCARYDGGMRRAHVRDSMLRRKDLAFLYGVPFRTVASVQRYDC